MVIATLTSLLASYGYAAVFAAVGLESAGVPVPGETTLIAAGVLAGTTHRLSVWGVLAAAALAAVIGDNAGYLLGARGGGSLLRRWGPRVGLDQSRLRVGEAVFARHGGKIVFFGRFVSVLRTYAAFLAGVNRMEWRRFALCNAAGGVLWAAVFSLGAYQFGNVVSGMGRDMTLALGGLGAVLAVTGFVFGRRHAGRVFRRLGVETAPSPLGAAPAPAPASAGPGGSRSAPPG